MREAPENKQLLWIGISQHGLKSLEQTKERYSSFTQNDDSSASSWSLPSHHWNICPHDEKRKVVSRCALLYHHILDVALLCHSQDDPGKGGHWQLVTKGYLSIISQNASSVSALLCTMCRTLIVFVRQRMIILFLFCNSRAFSWTAMDIGPG